jgi:ParB family transcriptional regulator, chromosome partitioning protein
MLARGLAQLLGAGSTPPRPPADGAASPTSSIPEEALTKVRMDLLQRGRYQPRVDMRPETLQELADSIKAQGVVQPIIVRPLEPLDSGLSQRYEIIAGERRWRAAQMAGLIEIPAVIRRVSDHAAIAIALIENIQRENLNPLEEARSIHRLITEFKLTHQEAATAIGRSRAGVTNMLRLLDLVPQAASLLETRQIEMGHARALLALTDSGQQANVASLIAKQRMSVRETEALVRKVVASPTPGKPPTRVPTDARLESVAQELAKELGASVAIQHSAGGGGKFVVTFGSVAELESMLARLRARHSDGDRRA